MYGVCVALIFIYFLMAAAYRNPPSKPVKEQDSEGTFFVFYFLVEQNKVVVVAFSGFITTVSLQFPNLSSESVLHTTQKNENSCAFIVLFIKRIKHINSQIYQRLNLQRFLTPMELEVCELYFTYNCY